MINFFKYFVPWFAKHIKNALVEFFGSACIIFNPVALQKLYLAQYKWGTGFAAALTLILSLGSMALFGGFWIIWTMTFDLEEPKEFSMSRVLYIVLFWGIHFVVSGIYVAYTRYIAERNQTIEDLTSKF